MEYLLKANAVIVIFYLCYKLFLQKDTFFETNRWFLLTGILVAVFIPFLVIPIYVESATLLLENYAFSEQTVTPENTLGSFNFLYYIIMAYFIGFMLFLINFVYQLISVRQLIAKNIHEKIGGYTYIKISKNLSPFSFFNYIVYNPDLFNGTELEQIITHEKVHVRQYHSFDILLMQLACIAFWFNPYIWLYNKDFKQNLEFIADKNAVNKSHCKKSYQYTLLKSSLTTHQLSLTNNFYNSLIKKRIIMLHKSKSKKINLLKYAFVIPVLALFLMSFSTEKVFINSETNIANYKVMTSKATINGHLDAIITKEFSDSDLDDLKTKFTSEGYTLKIKGIKRNKQGEITAIKIDVSSKTSNASYNVNADEAIKPIKISIDADGQNISIGNANIKSQKHMVFISEEGKKHELNNSDSDNNVFVISSDDANDDHFVKEIIIKNGDTISIDEKHTMKMIQTDADGDIEFIGKYGDSKKIHKVFRIKTGEGDGNLTWITEDDNKVILNKIDDSDAEIKFNSGKEPLFLADGKEITSQEMNDMVPETIDKIEVFKGDSATKRYGDKGKNGVVVITTKKKK